MVSVVKSAFFPLYNKRRRKEEENGKGGKEEDGEGKRRRRGREHHLYLILFNEESPHMEAFRISQEKGGWINFHCCPDLTQSGVFPTKCKASGSF